MPAKPMTAEQMLDFLRTHVRRDGDCLIWAGAIGSSGYPKITWNYHEHSARRLLLTLAGKKPRAKSVVIASCDNPACMSEAHIQSVGRLTWGAKHAGTMHSGAKHSLAVALGRSKNARMPITKAREVLAMRARGMTYRQIGDQFGFDRTSVGHSIQAWARAGVTL